MKKLVAVITLVILIMSSLSACAQTEEGNGLPAESWELGEHWGYSPQSIWGDTLVAGEYIFGNGLEEQYISAYNLQTREKERLKEIPVDYRFEEPSIYGDKVVWSACYYSEEFRMSPQKDFDTLDWNVFLLDLKTGEVRQITDDEYAQRSVRIYGDNIVWLDNRHGTGERYPYPPPLDVYAYDLNTGEEKRITSATTAEGYGNLAISGSLVIWADSRHADPSVKSHPSNDPDYNNEIYVYDLAANKERRVTTYSGNDHYPDIDGSRFVWLRQFTLREAEAFVYDLDSDQETQVSHNRYAAYGPDIYKDRIVWADARISKGNTTGDIMEGDKSGAAEIYLYDLGTGKETLLVPSEGWEFTMEMGGQDSKFTQYEVWLNPVIHGDFVVYTLSRMVGPIVHVLRLDEK